MPVAARVTPYFGKPVIEIDGEPIVFTAYSPTKRPELFFIQTQRFLDLPTRVFFINVPRAQTEEGDYTATPFWVGDQISQAPLLPTVTPSLEEQAQFILDARPDALLFVRFCNDEPASWRDLHQDQLFTDETGKPHACPSLASPLYRAHFAAYVAAVIRHCEQQPWSERLIGYWTGMRMEGTHAPLADGHLIDHSAVFADAWRDYLRAVYAEDAALREAWGDDTVSLDRPPLPRDSLRGEVRDVVASPFFQAGPDNAPLRDYLKCCRVLFGRQVTAIGEAHRTGTDRQRVFVIDALKQPMQGWDNRSFFEEGRSWPVCYHDMLAGSGHTDAAALLDTQGIDGLITPHDYQARGLGGIYEPEGAADTCVLRNKLFLCEMDTRSFTGSDGPVFGSAKDVAEFEAITWRNVAASITRGIHSYYMDVHTDWFADPAFAPIIRRQMQVMEESLSWEHRDVPGIAVILDDTAVYETNGNGAFANEAIMWQVRDGLAHCGVPYRIYLLDDLALDMLPDHRVFYFPNLFRIDEARRAMLHKHVLGRGRVVVWGPGTAISDGRTLSADHAAALTGFNFTLREGNLQRRTLICDFDHPLTSGLTGSGTLGGPIAFGPVLFPTDGHALGYAWTTLGRNLTGLAVKTLGDADALWHSVFTTTVPLPPAFWRGAAELGGAHVYCHNDGVVMADHACVALHTAAPGPHAVQVPGSPTVTDLVTGEPIPTDAGRIHFDAPGPLTRVFRLT